MAENFYSRLGSFKEFRRISDPTVYAHAPVDWFVVLTDVKNSTRAISEGRYRDVNTIGAASIAVVQSAMEAEPFPFVFGGDGATFLIPPNKIDSIRSALQKLSALSLKQFGLELRAGIVSIREIYNQGQQLEVGKFAINSYLSLAVLKGGGLSWSENQIKADPKKYCLVETQETLEVPQQLSCRWQPVASQKGIMLCLIIKSREPGLEAITKITEQIESICDGNLETSNPIQPLTMKYRGLLNCLINEFKFHDQKFSKNYLKRAIEILISWWSFKLRLPAPFPARAYESQMRSHSDYRKYDDVLRLILDCTRKQSDAIKLLLQSSYETNEIFFGLSESTHALMTCLVQSIQPGGHVHFIDGASGGYAAAARNLKVQTQRQAPGTK